MNSYCYPRGRYLVSVKKDKKKDKSDADSNQSPGVPSIVSNNLTDRDSLRAAFEAIRGTVFGHSPIMRCAITS